MLRRISPYSYRYHLQELVGEGLNSRVYRAVREDRRGHLRQPVALKILKSETLVELWKKEFETLTRVKSPYCVGVLGWEWLKDHPSLVLEFVEGVTLKRLIINQSLNREEVEDLCWQLLQGLKDLQSEGLCHGDISPNNVLIDVRGRLRLVDFGLANTSGPQLHLTPAYAAPEVLGGNKSNYFSDLYGLGVIYKELLGNLHPLPEEIARVQNQLLSRKWHERVLAQFKNQPNVRPSIGQKVEKLMAKDFQQTTPFPVSKVQKSDSYAKRQVIQILCCLTFILCSGRWPHAQDLPVKGQGILSIRTKNWIKITVDGQEIGYSPLDIWLGEGNHKIEWEGAQGKSMRSLTVQPGQHIFWQDNQFVK